MRLTDFWQRMEHALGSAYARSWAADFRVAALNYRTIAEGEDTQVVWRAVHETLGLEAKYR